MIRDRFSVVRVDRSCEATVAELLKQYCLDMKTWFPHIGADFTYPPEKVWNDDTHVYLAYVADRPAGLALVGSAGRYVGDAATRDMVEFFVMPRVRRQGLGRAMAAYLWNQYPGSWLVRVYRGNVPAMRFWRATMAGYANADQHEEVRSVAGEAWSYFTFSPSSQLVARP